jgi:hypothetical protein
MALLATEATVAPAQHQDSGAPSTSFDCESGSLPARQLGRQQKVVHYLPFIGAFCAAAMIGFCFVGPALDGSRVTSSGHGHMAKSFVPLTMPTRLSSSARASTNMVASESRAVANRREAVMKGLTGGAGLLAASALAPGAAHADSIEEIAARANQKAEADRVAAANKAPEQEVSAQDKATPVLAALGGSVALSVPFYYKNLQRLGTKIASGGKDSGYEKKDKGKPKRR